MSPFLYEIYDFASEGIETPRHRSCSGAIYLPCHCISQGLIDTEQYSFAFELDGNISPVQGSLSHIA